MPDPQSAAERGSLLEVVSCQVDLDLTGGPGGFAARSQIRFRCRRPGAVSHADLIAAGVRRAVLNGSDLGVTGPLPSGRLGLPRLMAENLLVVESAHEYVSAGAGLRWAGGPDGAVFVYSKGYPDGARRSFCCFDQPDLRGPITMSITAPAGWSCRANAPAMTQPPSGQAGRWQFAATPPIAPYATGWCAGTYAGLDFSCARAAGPELPVTVLTQPARAAQARAAIGPDLLQPALRYYERELGMAYAFGKCDLVFVPEYPGLAFGAPALITIQERVLDQAGTGRYLGAVLGHELAHAWFGGLIDLPDADGWLIEALTTWISRQALAETFPGTAVWQEAFPGELPDHAYAPYAAVIRQLEALIGSAAVLDGLRALLREHMYRCVTKDDLIRCWSQASGRDLSGWAAGELATEPARAPERPHSAGGTGPGRPGK